MTDLLIRGGLPLEARTADGDLRTLVTRFAVFNVWTEIHSWWEGDFLERLAPGAFAKTISERRDQIKVLYDHGMDFHIGNKILGRPEILREEPAGPWAEVPLLDTSYNRDLIPGLDAGGYGASFRFRVVKEQWNDEPDVAEHNPKGLPERTITEVKLFEFGPVTFPAYEEATAGLRSLTDQFLERMAERAPDRFASLLEANPEAAKRFQELRTRMLPAAPGTGAKRAATNHDGEPPAGTRRTPKHAEQLLRRIEHKEKAA